MAQVFRLMGAPDRVIAFDELPARLLVGFEMISAEGFPRHWKDWMGKTKKVTKISPEKDVLTGQVRTFEPIVEEDCFFYLVDWNLRPVVDKWDDICDFVARVAPKDFRLEKSLANMALPLAANKTDGVTLEPEQMVIVPIPIEFQEKTVKLLAPSGKDVEPENVPRGITSEKSKQVVKCDEEGCDFEAKGSHAKNSIRFHKNKKHPKTAIASA